MKLLQKLALATPVLLLAGHAMADATFFSREGLRGQAVTLDHRVGDFERLDFNNRASSVRIDGRPWEVCERAHFEGRCVVLRRGDYPSLESLGLNNAISSARPLERDRDRDDWRDRRGDAGPIQAPPRHLLPAPMAVPAPTVFEVPVKTVRAVMGPPQQRCWIEREQVGQPGIGANVGGAIVGGVLGGVLGNQVGKGGGRDLATVGGAVAGAAIGSQVGGGGGGVAERDVQRCNTVQSGQPAYWEVTYMHGGALHTVQMQQQPGPTIRVDARGQPVF